jgi:hypothetical protein
MVTPAQVFTKGPIYSVGKIQGWSQCSPGGTVTSGPTHRGKVLCSWGTGSLPTAPRWRGSGINTQCWPLATEAARGRKEAHMGRPPAPRLTHSGQSQQRAVPRVSQAEAVFCSYKIQNPVPAFTALSQGLLFILFS